jgi:wyosine [tRNA(Phe)-imidazoG37] synthetase (radical SAM superfamily)
VSQNGYDYTKCEDGWRLTHHLVAERTLGRSINYDQELVTFKDKDRRNLNPDNIQVQKKGKSSYARRLAQLEARKDEIEAEIEQVRKLIEHEASA